MSERRPLPGGTRPYPFGGRLAWRRTATNAGAGLYVSMAVLGAGRASAQVGVSFAKLVDETTPVPGGAGNLSMFLHAFVDDGQVVAIAGLRLFAAPTGPPGPPKRSGT